jgi:hypothetical protein
VPILYNLGIKPWTTIVKLLLSMLRLSAHTLRNRQSIWRCGVGSILTFPNIGLLGYITFTQKTNANAPIHSWGSLKRFANVRLLRQLRFAQ